MSDRYYLTDGGHVLISGATGAKEGYGGKTVTANWWYSEAVRKGWHDMGIFINPKGHSFIEGREISSLRGLAQSYNSGNRLFNVQVPHDSTEAVTDIVEWAMQLNGSKIIVFDEAQSYRDADRLDWVLSQGGNLDSGGFQSLVLTQRPWNLREELRMNLPVKIWVGPITSEGRKFFQTEQMRDVADRLDGDMKPYHWAVTDAGEYQHTNPPVPEEYA